MNALTPEFKRISAFNGDVVFHGPRRLFLDNLSGRQNAWSFRKWLLPFASCKHSSSLQVSKRQKSVPVFGSVSKEHSANYRRLILFIQFHSSDLLNIYFGGDLTDYLIYFINHLDPNGPTVHSWPQYYTSTRSLLTLWDGFVPVTITEDTFRQDAINVLINISLTNPLVWCKLPGCAGFWYIGLEYDSDCVTV